jgi:hypothetical protein
MDVVPPNHNSWLGRNRWKLGFALVALLGGVWWRRSHHHQRISVGSVSERWLAEQAFDAGQRSAE